MGGDGGSIPTRSDLIKTKRTRNPLAEQKQNARQLWSFCALSKQPLRAPIVSCPLGKLYNKEAVISYLLNPPSATESSPFGNDGILVASHIRNLKDLTTLRLTPNPSLATATAAQELDASNNLGTQEEHRAALFVCPISLREMNGTIKFVYRKPCGCVMSESSVREMRKLGAEGGDEVDTHVCPVDGARDDKDEEWVTLNPAGEEAEDMKELWEARKIKEKEEKKAAKDRKRKEGPSTNGKDKDKSTVEPSTKKAKTSLSSAPAPAVKAGSSVPLLSATLAAKIAEQKKAHSPAVASLYAKKGGDANHVSSAPYPFACELELTCPPSQDADGRSNWMTRGAFTHYA
ncbi:Rtf2 RING-finger-domain-containing protein [Leucosporidium creatinivorum]|uniref:Rtf2 RING-finger-domain-containing protein n=1 Tax=Leucosporidium creatinivorum TaxID=106004 RepID=A0A1Y2C2E5_9BASI|nr:Rtf2 RING-finger-domain-containing protein [Leucosporidium creatinivorum]